jgi:predicted DNA repair protein MutK
MAGILGFLAALSDDISSIAGRTMAGATSSVSGSLGNSSLLLDDIVTYTKVASAKTSGVVVDDLAAIANLTNETTTSMLHQEIQKAHSLGELKANIEKLTGEEKAKMELELAELHERVGAEAKRKAAARELPIVWKIAKGSALNKLIIIPLILLISAIAPWLMPPILIAGGIYLAYEGAESVIHKLFVHDDEQTEKETLEILSMEKFETNKVASAIKTDFILSLEIMVLALSLVATKPFMQQIGVLLAVAFITTVGVYGIVALIIKLDDMGYFLQARTSGIANKLGDGLVALVPPLLSTISVIGTVAMLAVGGGIIAHQLHLLAGIEKWLHEYMNSLVWLGTFGAEIILGMIVGFMAMKLMPIVTLTRRKIQK